MKRGDLYWADLMPRSGSEQAGRRPVVVVSHDGFNQAPSWRSVIVVPITTSSRQAMRVRTAVTLPPGAGGLPEASVAVCHQVTTLDRAKLLERLGELSSAELRRIETGVRAALDLD